MTVKRNLLFIFLIVVLIILAIIFGYISRMEQKSRQEDLDQQERQLIMEDFCPEGCNSCHKVTDKDRTIATYTNQHIQGHPVIDSKTIEDCMDCHNPGEERFTRRMHFSHLNSRIFTELMDSSCVGCHQMDDKGRIFIKGLR